LRKAGKINFNLGVPISGWIPVCFKSGDFVLEFTSSKVPENPTEKLCEALILIVSGVESEICWTEEPVCYYFKFNLVDDVYSFKINETDRRGHNQSEIFLKNGQFEDIIMPIYRGLKKWTTIEYQTSAWKKINPAKLNKLTELIKKRKSIFHN